MEGEVLQIFGTYQLNGIYRLWSLIRINYKKTFMGQLGKFEPWILRNDIKKLL